MSLTALPKETSGAAPAETVAVSFDLDIRTIELTGIAAQINLTDDGCGGTCDGSACNTAV